MNFKFQIGDTVAVKHSVKSEPEIKRKGCVDLRMSWRVGGDAAYSFIGTNVIYRAWELMGYKVVLTEKAIPGLREEEDTKVELDLTNIDLGYKKISAGGNSQH